MYKVIWKIDQGPNMFGGRQIHCENCGSYKTHKGAMKKAKGLKEGAAHRQIEIWYTDANLKREVEEII